MGVKGLRVQIPIFTFGSPWAESKPADTKTRSGLNWNKFHKQQILRVVFNLSNNPGLLRLWCLQKFYLWLRRLCTPHPKPIKQKMNNWSIKLYIYLFEFLLAPYSIYFGSGWLTFKLWIKTTRTTNNIVAFKRTLTSSYCSNLTILSRITAWWHTYDGNNELCKKSWGMTHL